MKEKLQLDNFINKDSTDLKELNSPSVKIPPNFYSSTEVMKSSYPMNSLYPMKSLYPMTSFGPSDQCLSLFAADRH